MKMLLLILVMTLMGCGDPKEANNGPTTDMGNANSDQLDAGARSDVGGEADAASGSDAAEDSGGATVDASRDTGSPIDPCNAEYTTVAEPAANPPFSGTAFVTNGLITSQDSSSFVDLTYAGTGMRNMYDRRVAEFINVEAHLFDAQFGSSKMVEIQVNPEFTQQEAETEARKYAVVVGRLPGFLFRDLETMWIHAGKELFGGGNRNILIHTEQGEDYGESLEEILVHEAVHTSVDAYHRDEPRWLEAVAADGVAISTYARDFPDREDLAESVGPYLAYRWRPDRFSAAELEVIASTMPNRIQYFDCQAWDTEPLQ